MSGPLGIEADIITRLREQIGEPSTVASGAAVDALNMSFEDFATQHNFPLITVLPAGGQRFDQAGRGRATAFTNAWHISILARHVVDELLVTDYSELDLVARAVIDALSGWQPASGTRPLIFETWPVPSIDREKYPGFVEFVLGFSNVYHFVVPTS